MLEWLLVVVVISSTGVATRPVETYKTAVLCQQAREAEYRVGLYAPLKDGTGRLLRCDRHVR